jgi:mannose-1-phosphate guanylyltransferase
MNGLKAMVLAAGHGVRLAPLTNELAKPACPVCNHPLIHFPLSRLASIGVKDVVVNLHHLPATVERAIENQPHPHPVAGRGRSAAGHRDTCGTAALGCGPRGAASSAPTRGGSFGLSVHTVFEAKILGTGGGLKNARSLLAGAETILLLNGDSIGEADLSPLVAAHRESGALATMLLLDDPRRERYGAVEVDAAGAVVDIAGLRGVTGARRGLFAGVHALSPEIFSAMPALDEFCINRQVHLPLLASRPGAVRAMFGEGRFFDLGAPTDYLEAQWSLLDDPGPFAFLHEGLAERRGVWVDPTAQIAEDAWLAGPTIVGGGAVIEDGATVGGYSVIGPGATVAAGARLERCVVWPGARAEGVTFETIVTSSGLVQL